MISSINAKKLEIMETALKIKLAVTVLLVVLSIICKSQIAPKPVVKHNSISLKFSNYNATTNCEVVEVFEQINGVKVAFSCVAAGLLIVESKEILGYRLKDALNAKLSELNKPNLRYDLLAPYVLTYEKKDSTNYNTAPKIK